MTTIPQQIEGCGWSLETESNGNDAHSYDLMYRAYQGGFKTLWRPTPEQCLKDVESIVKARKEQVSVPF